MSTFDLTVSPNQIEFVTKPGITIIQAYQITNNSSDYLTLNTEVLPWIPFGNDGQVSYDNITSNPQINFSLNNADLKLGQPFTLKPQESKQLVLKISSTPNAELKDYYYTFFISQNQSNLSASSGSFSQAFGKIGSHILLSVSNTEAPVAKSEIKNFKLTPKFRDFLFTKITFKAEIKNNTDYFFKTQGNLSIQKNGLEIKKMDLDNNNVLGHSSRQITCQNQESCTISPPFWPGHYTATLNLDPSLSAKPLSISFFVFPFSFVLFLILLISLILGFWFIKKSKKQN